MPKSKSKGSSSKNNTSKTSQEIRSPSTTTTTSSSTSSGNIDGKDKENIGDKKCNIKPPGPAQVPAPLPAQVTQVRADIKSENISKTSNENVEKKGLGCTSTTTITATTTTSATTTSTSGPAKEKSKMKEKVRFEDDTKDQNHDQLFCPVCKKVSDLRCAACAKIAYCSKEHQKSHWKVHKNSCTALKMCESPLLGRFLTASRDIKAGDLILEEPPLLLTPPKITRPVCLICYEELLVSEHSRVALCPEGCGWPICYPCSKNTENPKGPWNWHKRSECKFAKIRGGVNITNLAGEHPLYQSIGLLRTLALKDFDRVSFEKLMNLQSHAEERRQRTLKEKQAEKDEEEGPSQIRDPDGNVIPNPQGSDEEQLEMNVQLIQKFFQIPQDIASRDWIEKVSGIIEVNGHELPIATPEIGKETIKRLVGIYNTSSLFEHNCRPNCLKNFKISPTEMDIQIRTTSGIKKGDHVSISYVDALWGTNDRSNFLQMTKFFVCKCVRCCSSSELGTHISSLRCSACEFTKREPLSPISEFKDLQLVDLGKDKGFVLPEDPFNSRSEWKCNLCEEMYAPSYPVVILEKIGRELEAFQEKRGRIYGEEDFIQKYSKILHPNHFFLLEMKVELCQLYGRTPENPLPTLNPEKLERKIDLCQELLKVVAVILPGYSRLRSIILYELQAATVILSKFQVSRQIIEPAEYVDKIKQCMDWLKESIKVMSWEPEASIERRRADGAKKEFLILQEVLKSIDLGNAEITKPGKDVKNDQIVDLDDMELF